MAKGWHSFTKPEYYAHVTPKKVKGLVQGSINIPAAELRRLGWEGGSLVKVTPTPNGLVLTTIAPAEPQEPSILPPQ